MTESAYNLRPGDVIIGTSEINNACYEIERPLPKGFVTTGCRAVGSRVTLRIDPIPEKYAEGELIIVIGRDMDEIRRAVEEATSQEAIQS